MVASKLFVNIIHLSDYILGHGADDLIEKYLHKKPVLYPSGSAYDHLTSASYSYTPTLPTSYGASKRSQCAPYSPYHHPKYSAEYSINRLPLLWMYSAVPERKYFGLYTYPGSTHTITYRQSPSSIYQQSHSNSQSGLLSGDYSYQSPVATLYSPDRSIYPDGLIRSCSVF